MSIRCAEAVLPRDLPFTNKTLQKNPDFVTVSDSTNVWMARVGDQRFSDSPSDRQCPGMTDALLLSCLSRCSAPQ